MLKGKKYYILADKIMTDELLTSRTADGREFNIWKENMHIIRSLPFEMDSLDKTRKIRFLNPISSDKVLSPEKLSEMRGDIIVYPSEGKYAFRKFSDFSEFKSFILKFIQPTTISSNPNITMDMIKTDADNPWIALFFG